MDSRKPDNNVYKLSKEPVASVDPTNHYQLAYQLLKGHTVTKSVILTEGAAIVFDGHVESLEGLIQQPKCHTKPGIFVSKQPVSQLGWKEESTAEYRCLALEFDDGLSQEEQVQRFKNSGLPYSMLIWSGSKSVHALVVLESGVTKSEMELMNEKLSAVFPESDQSVISTLNKLIRFPIESGPYHQTLLEFSGPVKNADLLSWLDRNIDELLLEKERKLLKRKPSSTAQSKLRQYFEEHGKKKRLPCPICRERGKDNTGKNLLVALTDDGHLNFFCFRCVTVHKDEQELKRYFLSSENNPNLLIDLIQADVGGKYLCHARQFNWYKQSESGLLLVSASEQEVKQVVWPLFSSRCRELKAKIKMHNFNEVVEIYGLNNSVQPWSGDGTKVALQDGNIIDLKDPDSVAPLDRPTDFFLPISVGDWQAEHATPLWDQLLSDHADPEDQELLKIYLGYVFSGCPVSKQQCILIIQGEHDTGKSQILELVSRTLKDHAVRTSINDALSKPILAANLLGKRVALSSEAVIRPKDSAKFRALVSGEELSVKLLFKSELVVPHNIAFISCTNEIGWLENSAENKKRIRVVHFKNPVPKDKMDFGFIDKLMKEAPGIIVKCLKAYSAFVDQRIPFSESTHRYLDQAGQNVNQVASWLATEEAMGGEIFNSTASLFFKFNLDTEVRMDKIEFGRKMVRALGEKYHGRGKDHFNKEVKGFFLNKKMGDDQ